MSERGATPGSIFIWMGGNDVYGRPDQHPQGLDRGAIERVLTEVKAQGRVIMTGPTIRLWWDDGQFWESTPAFDADVDLAKMAQKEGVHYIQYLGRMMTIMRRAKGSKRHVVEGKVAAGYFCDRMGIHLSPKGYSRVLEKLHGVFFDQ